MVIFFAFVVVTTFLLIVAVNFEAIFARIEDFPYELLSDKEKRTLLPDKKYGQPDRNLRLRRPGKTGEDLLASKVVEQGINN